MAHSFSFRVAKIKCSPLADGAAVLENPARALSVIHGPRTAESVRAEIVGRWPEARRRDSVGAIELRIGASKAFFAAQKDGGTAFFRACLEWTRVVFGSENVMSVFTTARSAPEFVAYIVPLKDGRLSAASWLDYDASGGRGRGGPSFGALRRRFSAEVGADFGLAGPEPKKEAKDEDRQAAADTIRRLTSGRAADRARLVQMQGEREALRTKAQAALALAWPAKVPNIEHEGALYYRGDAVKAMVERMLALEKVVKGI